MSTTERREVHTTSVVRSSGSSGGRAPVFDHNLDHLLHDLQSSVVDSGREPQRQVEWTQNVTAANPATTYDEEIISSSGGRGDKRRMHKTETAYTSYSTSLDGRDGRDGRTGGTHHNRLDSLLDDLQQARDHTDREVVVRSSALTAPIRDTRVHSPNHSAGSLRTIQRELAYETAVDGYGEGYGVVRSDAASPPRVEREVRYVSNGTYGEPTPPAPATEVINPTILAQLEPNLLPAPNTKVTTTIKTYTYEIPGTPAAYVVQQQQQQQQQHLVQNQQISPSTGPPTGEIVYTSNQSTPSRSFAYSSHRSETTERNVNTGALTVPASPRARSVSPSPVPVPVQIPVPSPQQHHTYVYNETTTTTKNRNDGGPGSRYPYPAPSPSPVPAYGPHGAGSPSPVSPRHALPPHGHGPHGPTPDPNVNITYRYTSEHNSSNNYRAGGPPEETRPLLHPGPFPTNPGDGAGPPKRLDDLMAQFDKEPNAVDGPYRGGVGADAGAGRRTGEMQRAKAASPERERITERRQQVEVSASKNVSGPPVYYPPGHEMFARKEESMAYGSGHGAAMRESGKYKYEASSSSKTKTSGGVAVVPMCLPLCCGLPCVIL